ncbi:MAG: glycerophosphodiester phosphodiesterase [Acidimicrobiales bacterium]|jgi:glycerophosphoryl diester phosphodiesterase|nr:glycerophosphodiester phosphodiesterase [Acidimicrobiales bacterium]
MTVVPPRLPPLRHPAIGFAHRGARAHAPDNTLESFTLALRLGATGLEADVWLSADGKAVLDHDGVVGGRLRRRPIAALARAELPDHVPALGDLYATCGTDFELSLDLKDPAAAAEVIALARDVDAEERLWLCSNDWRMLASCRALSSRVRLVASDRLRNLSEGLERRAAALSDAGLDALSLHHSDWSGGLVAMAHRFGLFALAWDAQFERTLDAVLDAGIDGVYCDDVERMMEAIARFG